MTFEPFTRNMHIVITTGASEQFSPNEINEALRRHFLQDWGDVVEEDKSANKRSFLEGGMLLSSYVFRENKLWVITDAGWRETLHQVTTVLLPEEY